MLIIGIDPGISGSICFFEDGKILDVVEMPTMTEGKKNKKQVNGSQIYKFHNRNKQLILHQLYSSLFSLKDERKNMETFLLL